MLANTMRYASAHALRACGRILPAARSLATTSAASHALRVRHAFLITPSYKVRVAARGYATATATKTKTKPRTAAAAAKKKPAAKKAPVKAKAKATKKPVKAKAKPKKKKAAVKKPAAKAKKPKKVPSEAEKLVKAKRELKAVALYGQEPKKLSDQPWLIFNTEHTQGGKLAGMTLTSRVKTVAAEYKNITDSDKSRLEQKARENAAINAANHQKWAETYTPTEIVKANNARAKLLRLFPKGLIRAKLAKIQDERIPKRPAGAYAHYVKSQVTAFDGAPADGFKAAAAQWKSLSESEKKPYLDLAMAERSRYVKERQAIGLEL